MSGGYTVEVTNLSPNASEKDVYDFFSFSGVIDHIEIIRSDGYSSVAYVSFKEAHALETAVLLSDAVIVDQPVSISRWGHYEDDAYNLWSGNSWSNDEGYQKMHMVHANEFISSPGEAVTVAQEVVKTMLAKGYVLSKDALAKARALDQSFQISASAAAKVSELSRRVGLTDKINATVETAKFADERFHFRDNAYAAASATGRVASAAATAVVNSSYFSAGALWVSDALSRAAQAAADLAKHGSKN